MEKKTIGGFIAALRKANGMTQKELAERLNVSDKTVSRWERDDGAPDLSVIPSIAEIFDVTCDELLRGERVSPDRRAEQPEPTEPTSQKGEKQRQRLLKSTLSQYKNLTYISMGVSAVGMIVALICNLAFLKAVLGFLLGTIFFVAGIVCQAVFLNRAFLSVEDAGIDDADLSAYKRKVISLAERSIGLTVLFLGFTFPLVMVDAYMGLGTDSLFIWGTVGGAAFAVIYAVVLYFLNWSLVKKGVYTLSDKEMASYIYNRKLKKICAVSLVAALSITFVLHIFGSAKLWNPYNLAQGTVFNDYDSFIEYMGQDIPYKQGIEFEIIPDEENPSDEVWYDHYGNPVSREEALTFTLHDANGDVVCTYVHFNETVATLRYDRQDGTVLPITVISHFEFENARHLSELITGIYCILYPIELIVVLAVYYKKRAKQ